jgi:hypothetical protein
MSLIRDTLIEIRTGLGYDSAKAFYRYLSGRRKLDFNYAHYMKIEGAKALPSPTMISAIGAALTPRDADRLTLAYCSTIFPNQLKLFKLGAVGAKAPVPSAAKAAPETTAAPRQQYLTEAQLAVITRTDLHYALFLALTMARAGRTLSEAELARLLRPATGALASALADLEKARILLREQDGSYRSISTEMRFPKAESASLRKLYEQIDRWDVELGAKFGFESLLRKMMLRRVSSRYFGVILAHTNVLLDLIRASEELDPEYNDDVLLLSLSLSRGRMPG